MLSRLFNAHGRMCARHPWEVLIGTVTITISLMSMSLWATNSKVCGWNYVCPSQEELKSSDMIVISLTRCLGVMYIYLQFRNLRKLGSKYLLGLAGVFMIFSSFIFSIAIANLIGFDLNSLNEALPFFLLLIDLSKASALASFSLSATSQEELQRNIGHGMSIIGPAITLDAIVETLAIGVGTLSGVRQLETMCCFGCLSVMANYLAFMTFYPACLSLVLEISRDLNHGKPLKQFQQLAKVLQKEEAAKQSNPVTQHVKVIMSAGLVLVHIHSRLVAVENTSPSAEDGLLEYIDHRVHPEYPLWQFYIYKFLTSNLDYGATLLLSILLTAKYILFDDAVDPKVEKLVEAKQVKEIRELTYKKKSVLSTNTMPSQIRETCNGCHTMEEQAIISKRLDFQAASFFLGSQETEDSSSSSSEEEKDDGKEKQQCHIHTQTETELNGTKNEEPSLNGSHKASTNGSHKASANGSHKASTNSSLAVNGSTTPTESTRSTEECVAILNSDAGPEALTDEEIKMLVKSRHIPSYKLESMLGDPTRGVSIRRQMLTSQLSSQSALEFLPFLHYDYKFVDGACCENVIGYVPVPVGVAGPLLLDGARYQVPMATTEGCLVASTNRGCRAIEQSGGATSCVTNDGMTRGPVVRFPKAARASEIKQWLERQDNFDLVKECFDTTSRFARLKSLKIAQAGRSLYIRFVSTTGDAMGMNMLSKGSEKCLNMLTEKFPDMEIISLSGNYCTDKKPAAINWIEGRGKSVICEAIIKSNVVKNTLKTTVPALLELNICKNLVGSAMAGSIGGYNAHAANIVTAIYIAAGQDPAQNITSSNCIVLMEATGPLNEDLHITCTMPSIEVGTIGGGTVLPPQSSCLQMLGVKGSCVERPGDNARRLAQIVCGTVMAGELSLMSALAAGHLVKSHLKHNRSTLNMAPESPREDATNKPLSQSKSVPGTCINKAS